MLKKIIITLGFLVSCASVAAPYSSGGLDFDFVKKTFGGGTDVYLINNSGYPMRVTTKYVSATWDPVSITMNQIAKQFEDPEYVKNIANKNKALVFDTSSQLRSGDLIVEVLVNKERPASSEPEKEDEWTVVDKNSKVNEYYRCSIYKSAIYGWETGGWIPDCKKLNILKQ